MAAWGHECEPAYRYLYGALTPRENHPVGSRRFHDRAEAGASLADELTARGESAPGGVVVGLPRGGVVVAAAVAARLGLPLDVVVVRKVGAPQQPELGIGAVAEGGVEVVARATGTRLRCRRRALRPARRRRAGPCRRAGGALPGRPAAGRAGRPRRDRGRRRVRHRRHRPGRARGRPARTAGAGGARRARRSGRRRRRSSAPPPMRSSPCSPPPPSGRSASSTTASTRPPTPRSSPSSASPDPPPIRRSEEPDAPKRCIWLRRTIGGASRGWQTTGRDVPWHLHFDAGWSSPVARRAHNPKVAGSNPAPATM